MFPSRSTASDDVKLWLPRHKCRICGVEVEYTQVKVHYQTTHPEYGKWGRQLHTLMWSVLGSGIALVIGVMDRPAAAVLAVLLAAFIALLAQALLRGIDLRCGCFGGDERASWWTVVRDLVMLAAAVAVARGPSPARTNVTNPA